MPDTQEAIPTRQTDKGLADPSRSLFRLLFGNFHGPTVRPLSAKKTTPLFKNLSPASRFKTDDLNSNHRKKLDYFVFGKFVGETSFRKTRDRDAIDLSVT